jgi:hypothetical protein
MRFQFPPLYSGMVFLTVLVWLAIRSNYDLREDSLRSNQNSLLTVRQSLWSQQDAGWNASHQQEVLLQEKARAEEWTRALGGPLGAATKNPDLDIQQMIQQIAGACAPTDALVSVTVDRFTEFDVAVVLNEKPGFASLAAISRRLLQNTVPYIYSLRFIQGNSLLAELEDADIESVTNWNTLPDAATLALLQAAAERDQPVSPGAGSDDAQLDQPPAQQDLSPDQAKINQARDAFKEDYTEHVRHPNDLVSQLNRAARLDAIQTLDQFQAQISWLDGASPEISAERNYFINLPDAFGKFLNQQGLDAELINILKRGQDERAAAQELAYSDIFDAISEYQQQIRKFLETMNDNRNNWMTLDSGRIQFTTAEARNVYNNAFAQVQRAANAVSHSFRELEESSPSQ